MILGHRLLAEFSRRITGDVDLSPETSLGLPKRRGEVSQADAADHQQIHVAEGMFLAAGHRTINKRTIDTRLERFQRLLERWQQSGGFFEETRNSGNNGDRVSALKYVLVPSRRRSRMVVVR